MIESLKDEFEKILIIIYGNSLQDSVVKNYEWLTFLKNKLENKIVNDNEYQEYKNDFHPDKTSIKDYKLNSKEEENLELMKLKFENKAKTHTSEVIINKTKKLNAETMVDFSIKKEESKVIIKPKRKYTKKPKENK